MKKLLVLLAILSFNVFATPVDINKADAKEIASALKGIGPAKAAAIIKYRTKNGAFKSIDDLKNVKGIGKKLIKKIAADVGLSGKSISKKSVKAPEKTTKPTKKTVEKTSQVTEKLTKKAEKKIDKKTSEKISTEKSI